MTLNRGPGSTPLADFQARQAELWDTIAFCCTTIGEAIRERDPIAGTLASDGLLTNLAELPDELREMLREALT